MFVKTTHRILLIVNFYVSSYTRLCRTPGVPFKIIQRCTRTKWKCICSRVKNRRDMLIFLSAILKSHLKLLKLVMGISTALKREWSVQFQRCLTWERGLNILDVKFSTRLAGLCAKKVFINNIIIKQYKFVKNIFSFYIYSTVNNILYVKVFQTAQIVERAKEICIPTYIHTDTK